MKRSNNESTGYQKCPIYIYNKLSDSCKIIKFKYFKYFLGPSHDYYLTNSVNVLTLIHYLWKGWTLPNLFEFAYWEKNTIEHSFQNSHLVNFFFDFFDFSRSPFKLDADDVRWAGSSGRIGLPVKLTVEQAYSCTGLKHANRQDSENLNVRKFKF